MPRHARLRVAGFPLHVIQRGNNRTRCFRSERDFELYLGLLGELAAAHGCAVHAYVAMTNHAHLLLTPQAAAGASALMKHLGQRYAQYVNREYGRTGGLWEGRYKSSLVEADRYLLACYRYIELNPVRAGMVGRPGDYRWSSYRTNAMGAPSPIVTPHPEYIALADSEEGRRAAYAELFEREVDLREVQQIRGALNSGFALGGGSFIARVEAILGQRAVAGKPGRPRTPPQSGTVPVSNP